MRNVGRFRDRTTAALAVMAAIALIAAQARGHFFVFEFLRAGACPSGPGEGWVGEVFLNIPDESAIDLRSAEQYTSNFSPDFRFKTPWIDFPAGPVAKIPDSDLATLGDLLDDYIFDVTDPTALDRPMAHMLIRFTGFLKVSFLDDSEGTYGLPVWVDFAAMGRDGFRVKMGSESFRIFMANETNEFFHDFFIIEALGLFPIEITYFNRYDPSGTDGAEFAGIELYSWHGGGLPWPAGERLTHATRGASTIVPPRVIHQGEEKLPSLRFGDYDADTDIDLADAQWFQVCFTGPGEDVMGPLFLDIGCRWLDFDFDIDIDTADFAILRTLLAGPGS